MLREILIEPSSCRKNDTAVEVASKLKGSMQRHIYVVDESNYPVGIISTTDINNRIVAEGKDPRRLDACDIMSSPIEVYDIEHDPIEMYKDMMSNKRLTCAVIEGDKFKGIITLNRLVTAITG